jgi:CheY-like chemotaxis protein
MKRIYTPVKKKTILIVDDDQVVVHIYREKFQRQGFKIEVADNGDNVMQRLTKEPVDLVILDLCLPGMNGVEVLKNIRSEFDVQALPVIVFSNSYLGKLERAALEAGATKCVTKAESTPGQMLELVRELLAARAFNADGMTSDAAVSNATETLEVQSETEIQEKLVATVLNNAPQTLAKFRTVIKFWPRRNGKICDGLSSAKCIDRFIRCLAPPPSLVSGKSRR